MVVFVKDSLLAESLLKQRQETGADKFDEVWNGVYIMNPIPNDEHQEIVMRLSFVLAELVEWNGLGHVRTGVNITDLAEDWKSNYRVPDIAVYLENNPAENRGSNWLGGPDLAVEIISPEEIPFQKLDFYASIGAREVLVIERSPWQMSLFRLDSAGFLNRAVVDSLAESRPVELESVPLTLRLLPGEPRPGIEATAEGIARVI